MRSSIASRFVAMAIMTLGLAACGGGGGEDSGQPTAEGAYAGTQTGVGGYRFDLWVLEDGEFWLIHGTTIHDMLFVAGFTQGTGSSSAGRYTSGNARDYSLAGTFGATVSATYVAGTSAQGTVTYPGIGQVQFSGTTAAIAPYDYNARPTLSSITGTWYFTHQDGNLGTATIAADGSFTTVSGGCTSTGTITPHASGKNVYSVTQTFSGNACPTPGVSGRGICVHLPIAGTSRHQLILGSVSNDRSVGNMIFSER